MHAIHIPNPMHAANTKFTYHYGPYVPPYAGWLEYDTTQRLVASWRANPLVRHIMYWFYPDAELDYYHQPNTTAIHQWFQTRQPVPADCF